MRFRRLLVLVALAAPALAGAEKIQAWPVEPKNPTRWTFDVPIEDARTLLLGSLCRGGRDMMSQPWAVTDEPGPDGDIRLPVADVIFWRSPVYHGAKPFVMIADFRLRLSAPAEGKTTVEVVAERPRVVTGQTSGALRIHGPANIEEAVEPSTVEEYAILRECGQALGARDMPALSVPGAGLDAIVALLRADKDTEEGMKERVGAMCTLTFMGGPEVAKRLLKVVEEGGQGGRDALLALLAVGTADVVPALERVRESTDDAALKKSLIGAIDRIKNPEGKSVAQFVEDLGSKYPGVRRDAAFALVRMGKELERARPILEEIAAPDKEPQSGVRAVSRKYNRWRAAAALVRIRRASAGR